MSIVNDTIKLIKEFKPALLFLLKFLGMYVILSIFYGIYVESFGTNPDTITIWVSQQTSGTSSPGWLLGKEHLLSETLFLPEYS